jgi:hypothetical protein
MQTLTVTLTDGMYETILREAAKRVISVDEVIDDLLLKGESSLPDESPEEIAAFYVREEHHLKERRALRERHESLAKQLRA